jgi:hypothetical protein
MVGTHQINNLKNTEKGKVMLDDHKKGLFTTIKNTENAGTLAVSGNHVLDNIKNTETAKMIAMERKFDDKGNKVALLII